MAIDVILGIRTSEERKSHQDYVDKLKDRLADAYQNASEEARQKGKKYKRVLRSRYSPFSSGNRLPSSCKEGWCQRQAQVSLSLGIEPIYREKPTHAGYTCLPGAEGELDQQFQNPPL